MHSIYGCLDFIVVGSLPEIDSLLEHIREEGVCEWDIEAWYQKNHKKINSIINTACKARLHRIFNENSERFENSIFNWRLDSAEVSKYIKDTPIDYRLEVGKERDGLRILKEKKSSTMKITLLLQGMPDLKARLISFLVKFLLGKEAGRNVFLMPAERNGLHLFFRELSSRRNALLHHVGSDEIDIVKLISDVLNSKYSQPIADYIDWLNAIRNIRTSKSANFHQHAEQLKNKIIAGKYEVDSEGNITFLPKKKRNGPQPQKMSLHLTSSTVKSIFGLWAFLEYEAKPGDILMIDEPEINLHPSAQRQMARFLASVANSGIKVILSTHSDYFVREINSLIMLNRDFEQKSSLMKKYGYSELEIISPSDVSAYLFERDAVTKMDVGIEEGIDAKTFDDVINSLNETNDEIYYAILG